MSSQPSAFTADGGGCLSAGSREWKAVIHGSNTRARVDGRSEAGRGLCPRRFCGGKPGLRQSVPGLLPGFFRRSCPGPGLWSGRHSYSFCEALPRLSGDRRRCRLHLEPHRVSQVRRRRAARRRSGAGDADDGEDEEACAERHERRHAIHAHPGCQRTHADQPPIPPPGPATCL